MRGEIRIPARIEAERIGVPARDRSPTQRVDHVNNVFLIGKDVIGGGASSPVRPGIHIPSLGHNPGCSVYHKSVDDAGPNPLRGR